MSVVQILVYSQFLDGTTGMALFNANLITEDELLFYCNVTAKDLMKPGNPTLQNWQKDDILPKNGKKLGAVVSPKFKEHYRMSTTPWRYDYLWASYYGRLDWIELIMDKNWFYFLELNGAAMEIAFDNKHYDVIERFVRDSNFSGAHRGSCQEYLQTCQVFVDCFLDKITAGDIEIIENLLELLGTRIKELFEHTITCDAKNYTSYSRYGYPHIIDAAVASGSMEMLDLILAADCLGGFQDPQISESAHDNDDIWLFGGKTCLLDAYTCGRRDMLEKLIKTSYKNFYLHSILEDYYKECVEHLLQEKIWIPTADDYRLFDDRFDDSRRVEKLVYDYLPDTEKLLVQRYHMTDGQDQRRRLKHAYQLLCGDLHLDDHIAKMILSDQMLPLDVELLQEVRHVSYSVAKHVIGEPQ
jgi:hypothetical protein